MQETIMQVDQLLSMLEVRGNSVLILADARKALGEVYKMAEEAVKKEEATP